jgi:hypothetical protein
LSEATITLREGKTHLSEATITPCGSKTRLSGTTIIPRRLKIACPKHFLPFSAFFGLVRSDHHVFRRENRLSEATIMLSKRKTRLSEATIASENPRRAMVHRTIGSVGRRPAFKRSIDICRLRRIIMRPCVPRSIKQELITLTYETSDAIYMKQ